MRKRLFLVILVIFIAILLPKLPYIVMYLTDNYENTTGSNIAQEGVENYLNAKYPNNKLSIVSVNYISMIHVYECTVKDEDGITFSAAIDENSVK